eukprot:TRINITY_DN546_c0_g1_i1.p1 TRINITY_DN546_c0_g1~~TRINITY_DN546_c0_g1_i1.p1  ORF type:complete len:231 (-),score=52.17 TRINITY_DN546_c0_g1_i1:140-832(-)
MASKENPDNLPLPRIATDADFEHFKDQCTKHEHWELCTDKEYVKVWAIKVEKSDINMIKMRAPLKNIEALTLYDVMHDPQYRREWDENMIEGYEMEELDPNNDVGYYSIKMPATLTNRDFVNQRSWRAKEAEGEYIIKNHSVYFPKCPEKKGFIRARSLLTGYYIQRDPAGGCVLTYLTQADIKGHIPSMISNAVTKKLVPSIVKKLEKAASEYPAWKAKHNPEAHPWRP